MMNHQINIGFETEVADENSVRELIRTCADFDGLGPNWFRVAVRTAAENQRLIKTMEGLL